MFELINLCVDNARTKHGKWEAKHCCFCIQIYISPSTYSLMGNTILTLPYTTYLMRLVFSVNFLCGLNEIEGKSVMTEMKEKELLHWC